jgi:putative DNA primase/helicase
MKQAYQAQSVKDDARGRWERVLPDLAPVLKEAVERRGKHVPCPVHGGRDGFRVFPDVDQTGGGVCNTCGFFADGLSLLMWVNDWDFSRTIREVAEHVGGQPVSSTRRQWPLVASGMSDDATRREHLNRTWREAVPLTHPQAEPARLYSGTAWSGGNGTTNPALSSRSWVTTPIGVSWGAIQPSSPKSPGRGAMQ